MIPLAGFIMPRFPSPLQTLCQTSYCAAEIHLTFTAPLLPLYCPKALRNRCISAIRLRWGGC
jgi:hypothetical protein